MQKTIKFGQFQNMTNLTSVEVTFKMNKGHILKNRSISSRMSI